MVKQNLTYNCGSLEEKYNNLEEILRKNKKACIAYSAGVDSTYLLNVATKVLGKENVIAVTVQSIFQNEEEVVEAENHCVDIGVKHKVIKANIPDVVLKNPVDRCYHCKKEVFVHIIKVAKENGFEWIVDGTNFDDLSDYRPGLVALRELNVDSPLASAGLTKNEIRVLSKGLGLYTHSKPSFACAATRIPYGTAITEDVLSIVLIGEKIVKDYGFEQFRLRVHGKIARLEIAKSELLKASTGDILKLGEELKSLGYDYVTLDMEGYRSGSMNLEVR